MSQGKERLAEYLFDEIGGIDDSIITSAMGSYPRHRRGYIRRKAVIAIAAVLSLSVFTVASIVMLNRAGEDLFDSPNASMDEASKGDGEKAPADNEPDYGFNAEAVTLATRLNSLKNTASAEKLYASEIKYFDGYARIVWKYSDEEYYRVCKISSSDLSRLKEKIENDQGKLIETAAESSVAGIWISLGDGRVVTPCLLSSEGNVGYGSVFDYTAEVEPSESLAKFICDIIGKN